MKYKSWYATNIFFLLLFFYSIFVSFNTEFTAWVEMLVYPYLLNNGFLPYKDVVAPYTPLVLYFLQIFTQIFGYEPRNFQILTIILGWLNSFLIFWTIKKIWKHNLAAYFGACSYALWFFYFEGNGIWFELLLTPLIICFFYHSYKYLFKAQKNSDLIISSLLLALIFFSKQSGIYFSIVFILWLLIFSRMNPKKILKPILFLVLSFSLVFTITSLVALLGNYLFDYWRWAFQFTFLEFPFSSGHKIYPTSSQILKLTIPLIILMPLIYKVVKLEKNALYIFFLILASFMLVFPRWGLFHLQPFIALLFIGSSHFFIDFLLKYESLPIIKKPKNFSKFVLFFVVIVWIVVTGRQMQRFWDKPIRFFDPTIYRIASEISARGYTNNVYIFNSPDQLYLLTGSVPAIKPYVQNFSWQMEVPGVQEKIVASLHLNRPEYIIYSPVNDPGGLEVGRYEPKKIVEYLKTHYILKDKIADDVWVLEKNSL